MCSRVYHKKPINVNYKLEIGRAVASADAGSPPNSKLYIHYQIIRPAPRMHLTIYQKKEKTVRQICHLFWQPFPMVPNQWWLFFNSSHPQKMMVEMFHPDCLIYQSIVHSLVSGVVSSADQSSN